MFCFFSHADREKGMANLLNPQPSLYADITEHTSTPTGTHNNKQKTTAHRSHYTQETEQAAVQPMLDLRT